ncbi:MAG: acyl carrier protein [Planctomycetota bacterium]
MSDRNEIIQRLRAHLEESSPSGGEGLDDDASLFEDWFVDSLAIITLVVFLEQSFGIEMRRVDIDEDNFRSINTLASFIAAREAEQAEKSR